MTKVFKVYVNGRQKSTMLTANRMMILSLEKEDELDCICFQGTIVYTYNTEIAGVHHVMLSKEGKIQIVRPGI